MTNTTKRFATGTGVSKDQTIVSIEALLDAFGATGFAYAKQGRRQVLAFEMHGRQIRLMLDIPPVNDPDLLPLARAMAKAAKIALPSNQAQAYTLVTRQRWRALHLVIKAKLVAIQDGIRTFDQEFAFDTALPNGMTLGDALAPHLARAAQTGFLPQILPGMPIGPLPELPDPVIRDGQDDDALSELRDGNA
jgi:hypothetical protein